MNATSPLLNYTRAFLAQKGLLPSQAPLVIDEESITVEMIGLLRRRDDLFAFTISDTVSATPRYHARLLHHETRNNRLYVRYIPVVEAHFEKRNDVLAFCRTEMMKASPFGYEDRTHVVLVHELLYHAVLHAKKAGIYKALLLPATAPIPQRQLEYLNFQQLHGWPPPRNGQVLVPLFPAGPEAEA